MQDTPPHNLTPDSNMDTDESETENRAPPLPPRLARHPAFPLRPVGNGGNNNGGNNNGGNNNGGNNDGAAPPHVSLISFFPSLRLRPTSFSSIAFAAL